MWLYSCSRPKNAAREELPVTCSSSIDRRLRWARYAKNGEIPIARRSESWRDHVPPIQYSTRRWRTRPNPALASGRAPETLVVLSPRSQSESWRDRNAKAKRFFPSSSPICPATIEGTMSNTSWSASSPSPATPGASMFANSTEVRPITKRGLSRSASAPGL